MFHATSKVINVFMVSVILLAAGALWAQEKASAPTSVSASASPSNPLQLAPSHFTLSVAEIDKESAWYHDVLGFEEYERVPHGSDFVHCSLRIPGVYRIDLNWQKGSSRHSTPGYQQGGGLTGKGTGNMEQGYTHIVFKTALSLDSVDQQLVAKNANVVPAKNESGKVTNILVYDPRVTRLKFSIDSGSTAIGGKSES